MVNENTKNRERHRKLVLPGEAEAEFWLERLGNKIEAHYTFASKSGGGSGGIGTWLVCSHHGCLGEALPTGACLLHSDQATKQAYLRNAPSSNSALSLKGLVLSQSLWDEIVASSIFVNGAPVVPISFVGAEISATIRITGCDLNHSLDFSGASVYTQIEFRDCKFSQALFARYAMYNRGGLNCPNSTFLEDVDISYSESQNSSFGFGNCVFKKRFIADGIDISLHLSKSEFMDNISFKHARGNLILDEARIIGSVDISYADFVQFTGPKLYAKTASYLGPCKIKYLDLTRATFQSRVHLDVIAESIILLGANLEKGGLMDFQSQSVDLKQISIGGPFRVSGKLEAIVLPEIHGLLNSDAGQISFAHVDLRKCSFYGAHGLEKINIESTSLLSRSPWWHGKRCFIADEFSWRVKSGWWHSYGWKVEGVHVGSEPPKFVKGEQRIIQIPKLGATQVAEIYRGLRRSFESKSDMAGAADFYYGEMEMRKWSAPFMESSLLWLYCIFSGYSMRAKRALIAWVLLCSLGAYLMMFDGFSDECYSISRAILFSIRATIPGFTSFGSLTPNGLAIETGLRLFGPLFIALFLIAVRAKLMRKPSE